MNLSGAEKPTRWLGEYLSKETGVQCRRGEGALEATWEKKLASYYEERNRQEKEWQEKQNGGQN